jgi:hypothetical protein
MNAAVRITILLIVAFVAAVVGFLRSPIESFTMFYVGTGIAVVGVTAAVVGQWNKAIAAVAQIVTVSWRLTAYSLIVTGLIFMASGSCVSLDGNDRADRTWFDILTLSTAVKTYKLRTGANPRRLDDVLKYINGGTASNLNDAWGRRFDYDPDGPRNGGKQPDIWTVSPNGELIGNWMHR